MRGPVVLALAALLVLSAASAAVAALPTHLSDWGITPWSDWNPTDGVTSWNSLDGIAMYHVSDSWFGPNAKAPGAAWRHRGTLDKLPNPSQWSKVGYAWTDPTDPRTALADGFNWASTNIGGAGGEDYDLEGLYLNFGTDSNGAITSLDYALVDGWRGSYSDPNAVDVYRHIPVLSLEFGIGDLPLNAGDSYHYALALGTNDDGTMAFTAKDANRVGTTNNSRFKSGSAGDQYLEKAGLFRVNDNGDDVNPGDWISTDDGHTWKGWAGVDGDKYSTINARYQGTAIASSTQDAGFEYLGQEGGHPAYLWTGSIDLTGTLAGNDPLWSWLNAGVDKWWTGHYTYWCDNDRMGGGTKIPGIPDVPELGPWALALLGLAPMMLSAARLRRRRS